jgi:hypothetical protein
MYIPTEAWGFLGPLCAAVVAGAVSFVVTVLSKEQKTSEFRQAWIDGLRQDLADFAGIIAVHHPEIQSRLKRGEDMKAIEATFVTPDHLATVKQLEITRLRILFRLNPTEHETLIERLDALYHYSAREESKHPGTEYELFEDYVAESQRVLKKEWKRVKRGEPTFQVTKWASLLLVIAATVVGGFYALRHMTGSEIKNHTRLHNPQPPQIAASAAMSRRHFACSILPQPVSTDHLGCFR